VFELADDYSYAFVSGYNTDYLWLLAREPQVSADVRERFIAQSRSLGFETDDLIWVVTE
jgi:apolipoprotein D and lipocalin family protein